jgi:uncharacterized protein involved in type VI secretion and phage assembly
VDERVARYIERNEGKYWGKCRGLVVDRSDPEQLGRLRLKVPSIFGTADTGWASPASPYAGADIGFFFLPQVGDMVWVEFEEGELDHPIWSGGSWARPGNQSELPAEAKPSYADQAVIKTKSGNVIVLSDAAGAERITIRAKSGCEIVIDPTSNKVMIQADEVLIRGGKDVEELATKTFVQTIFDGHTHPTGVGPTGPPSEVMPVSPGAGLSARAKSLTSVLKAE